MIVSFREIDNSKTSFLPHVKATSQDNVVEIPSRYNNIWMIFCVYTEGKLLKPIFCPFNSPKKKLGDWIYISKVFSLELFLVYFSQL